MKRNENGFSAFEALLVLVIIGVIGFVGYKTWSRLKTTNSSSHTILAKAKQQYSGKKFTAGYLKIAPSKFEEIGKLTEQVGPIKAALENNPNINSILFEGNELGFSDSALYLYDISNNKVHKIADGGSSAARIMSDHYVVYGFSKQNSDGTQLSVIVLNLQTGEKKTIVEGDATQLTGNNCCAVSPDGLKLAIPQKGKILVWNAQNNTTIAVTADLDPFSEGFPTDKSFFKVSPYFVEMGYPNLAWLNNTKIAYANHPPHSMNSNGSTTPTNNNLLILDTEHQDSKPFKNLNIGIANLIATNNGKRIFADNGPSIYQFDPETLDSKLLAYTNWGFNSYSPDGSKFFNFQALHSIGSDTGFSVNTPDNLFTINGVPDGVDEAQISQIIPESWISDNLLLIKIYANNPFQSYEWEGVYDSGANKVIQYVQVN